MPLKPTKAVFEFEYKGEAARVVFTFTNGKPQDIHVFAGSEEFSVDNSKGTFRPCVTHCRRVIDHSSTTPPKSPHAKQQRRTIQPKLSVFG